MKPTRNNASLIIPMAIAMALVSGSVYAASTNTTTTTSDTRPAHGAKQELTEAQPAALETARSLRAQGKDEEAKSTLLNAGLPDRPFGRHRHEMNESRAKLETAISANDYATFSSLKANTPFSAIDESGFAKLVEAQKLRDQGKHDEAKAIMDTLGITRMMHGGQHHEHMDKIIAATKANDYSTWKSLVAGTPFENKSDEATFAKLVEMEKLRANGDEAGAKAIMDGLGITPPDHERQAN